jgi:hypothetical protein
MAARSAGMTRRSVAAELQREGATSAAGQGFGAEGRDGEGREANGKPRAVRLSRGIVSNSSRAKER